MLNCKEVSKLVSESLDRKVSLWKRINMWMHLGMCGICWSFRKNLVLLKKLSQEYGKAIEENEFSNEAKLPNAARGRIQKRLDEEK